MSDGGTLTFVVDEVRQVPKLDLPTGDLFRRVAPSTGTLFTGDLLRRVEPHQMAERTWGGTFDAASRRHGDSLVVIGAVG